MSKLVLIARAAIAGVIALLFTTALSAAQNIDQPPTPAPKARPLQKGRAVVISISDFDVV